VLAAERRNVERVHGTLSGAEFLQIVSDPVRYGWLKPLTALVLALDPHEDDAEVDVVGGARELLLPPKGDTPFGATSRCCSASRRSSSRTPRWRSSSELARLASPKVS